MDDPTHLLLAAAQGDRAAFDQFVRATQPDVWRFCAHLVAPDAADDLTQDVYLRVASAMTGFRGDAPAHTWLFTVARRTCADHLRTVVRRRGRETPTDPLVLASAGADTGPDHHVELDHLLRALDPARREALVLTQVLGFTYAQAAATAGVAVGTIRSRVARARADLSRAMQADDGNGDRAIG